jgi:Bacterial Ig domain
MDEDGSPTAFGLTLHAADAEADTITWSISTTASHGASSAGGTGTSKVIGYCPAAHYSGSGSFVVYVSDGKGGSDTITVYVTVRRMWYRVCLPSVARNVPFQQSQKGKTAFVILRRAILKSHNLSSTESAGLPLALCRVLE